MDNKEGEFIDFVLFGELFYSEDENVVFDCPHCGAGITQDMKVEVVNISKRAFKCPECDGKISLE
jgi:predicted RNA-binding Zn-ribbon protein involved in translation (DUF1610 family)